MNKRNKTPDLIVVTPRFNNEGNFSGYNQVAGNVYLDTHGHLYGLVRLENYNELSNQLTEAINIIEELVNIVDDLEARKQIDSFTAQPARTFLYKMGERE